LTGIGRPAVRHRHSSGVAPTEPKVLTVHPDFHVLSQPITPLDGKIDDSHMSTAQGLKACAKRLGPAPNGAGFQKHIASSGG
jgi:hypothetical protein